ncbi:MAG: DUF29 domain-containing protein [Nitrospirae bacterium]|nr:DUF29 domain-containing protein [Nitrospirota bacterium]
MSVQKTIHNDIVTEKSLYDTDFYQWTIYNAALLRQGRFSELDVENIAEEIETMGRSEKRELINRLSVLIMHLLKLQYQPQQHSKSWITTIGSQRTDIEFLLEDSPSLEHEIELIIEKAYERAKVRFQKDTGISQERLPDSCPYTFEQLIDDNFWPKGNSSVYD